MKGQVLVMKYKNVRLLFILIVASSVVLTAVKASSVTTKVPGRLIEMQRQWMTI